MRLTMSDSQRIEQPTLSRAERRRTERAARKMQSALLTSVSRIELSKILAPLTSGLQMHEAALGFIVERGLKIEQGRAILDADEFNAYLAENQAAAEAKRAELKEKLSE